jgi:hypothetical protein
MATVEAKSYRDPAFQLTAFPGVIHRLSKAEDFTINASTDDVLKFFKLPVNAKIVNVGFFGETLGAAGTMDLIITDGTTTKVVLNEAVVTAATYYYDARVMHQTGLTGSVVGEATLADWFGFVTDDDDWEVRLRVGATQVTTPTAGNIQVFVDYTLMLEAGEST